MTEQRNKMHAQLRFLAYSAELSVVDVTGKKVFEASYPKSVTPRKVRRMLRNDGWKVGLWRRSKDERPIRVYSAKVRRPVPPEVQS